LSHSFFVSITSFIASPSLDFTSISRALPSVSLGNHLKTGHTLSVQNRPMGLAEDVIVLPCRSVHLQGAIRDVAVMACFQAFLMHVMVVVAPPGSRLAE
jgi:hypothetical protein